MTIKVYPGPSTLPGEPLETHEWSGGTMIDWFTANRVDIARHEGAQKIEISVNGIVLPEADWALRTIAADADVRIHVIPGGGVFDALSSIIKLLDPALNWFLKSMTPKNANPQQQSGAALETVQASANEAKLGSVVPELLGRHIRYPEYLTPPHRFFEGLRTQRVHFLACVGPGLYSVEDLDVKIGDTPFSSIGDDAEYHIYPPGTELVGDVASEHWHTVNEVGGTSSGTPGLVLSTESANRDNSDPASYVFDWDSIQRTSGEWPSGWGPGSNVQIEFPSPYEVATISVPPTESAPGYLISEITGWFHHFPNTTLVAGQTIGLGPFGAVETYRIRSITPVAPTGNYTIRLEEVGSSDPIVLTPGAAVTLRFGSDLSRNIYDLVGQDTIQVAPGRFQTQGVPLDVPGAKVRYLDGTAYGEWSIEVNAVPGNETTGTIEFDVFFPGGLAYIAGDGELEARSVSVQFQYRDIDTDVRTTVTRTYTQNTLDQIGFTERIDIDPAPRIRPACRMRRITANSTSTQIVDTCHWYGLKTRLPTRTVYPNWTTMSASLRSGGRIAAASENQINLVAVRVIPELQPDLSFGPPVPTRRLSASFRHVLNSIGYADSGIDLEELLALDAIWNLRADTCDYVFDQTTVREALNTILAAGMAELTMNDGLLSPVREGVRTVFEQAYSPQNYTSPLQLSFRSHQPSDSDGVEVEFMSPNGWTSDVVRCGLPGDAFFKVEKVKVIGVTDRTRAWRIGMRYRRALEYRRRTYNFGTELDALNSKYKSYVPLFDETPGFGQSARLVNVSDAGGGLGRFRLSEELNWEDGANHTFGYRSTDGKFVGPFSAERGGDNYEVLAAVPQPWPVVTLKLEPIHAFFGVAERFCYPALITGISPQGAENVTVSAEDYDDRIYADDDNAPA